ncbi:MAG TPA: response regulator [Bacteroidetes bacterium]|nr:response regulator [Bacteroidota bacterium]
MSMDKDGVERFRHYNHSPGDTGSLSNDRIMSICQDRAGSFWLATQDGLNQFRLNPVGDDKIRFTNFKHNDGDPKSLSSNLVRVVYTDYDDNLWIGTVNGLNRIPRVSLQGKQKDGVAFTHYFHDKNNQHSLSNNYIYSITQDQNGNIWIGTIEGLNRFDAATGKFTRYLSDAKDPFSLNSNAILSLYFDHLGTLWVGTPNGGLNKRITEKSNDGKVAGARFVHYTEKDGLPNELVYAIVEDDSGLLWLSTNKGLSRFDPKTEKFRNFNMQDGLQSNEFNLGAGYKDRSGKIYFGGINGFNSFLPGKIVDNPYVPPILITDFKIFNQSVPINENSPLKKSITETKEITLSYKDYVFSFEIVALHFSNPEENRYAYKLAGFDRDWINLGHRRYVPFHSLPPGEYVFRVKGSNSDGVWNEAGASLKITITPPIWQTGWFRTLGIISLILFIGLIVHVKTRSVKRTNKELENRVEERTREIKKTNNDLKQEISERKRTEKKLRLTQFSVDHSADAVFWIGPDAHFQYVNDSACKNLGYSRDELLTLTVHDIDAKFTKKIWPEHWENIKKQGSMIIESQHLAKDGRTFPVELVLNYLNFEGKEYNFAFARDITERKYAEGELNQAIKTAQTANRAKSDFLANMSHEIRTPMNGVIGMTDLLLDTKLNSEQQEYAEIVRSSADTLLKVINDILDFSKIEAGKLEMECIDFDLRFAVEDIASLLAHRAQSKGLELACLIYNEVPSLLKGDPGRLRQVLINLANNAIKFTKDGEVVIRVKLVEEEDARAKLRFEVSDTGIGIPADRLRKIFNPFTQVDASTTRKFGGTGLGLAISKEIAEMMGGEIGVDSKEGEGSTFWFTAVFEKQPGSQEVKFASLDEIRNQKILIVDDNATNRFVLTEQLQALGCKIGEANCGREALTELRRGQAGDEPYDIAILDMMMPEMDGETLGRKIKNDPELHHLILIMLTSIGERGEAKRIKKIGFKAYLTKPVKQAQLYECLATVVNQTLVTSQPGKSMVTRHSLEENRKHNFRILLAEDNLVNQKVALHILEKLGFHADVTNDGAETLEALKNKHYDLILMDVQMPVLDGFATTKIIRDSDSDVPDHDIKIVAMTAHAMKGDREACLDVGMDDYIAKPIEPEALLQVIEKHFSNYDARNNKETHNIGGTEKAVRFDRQSLLNRLDNDTELLAEIITVYIEDFQNQQAKLKSAVKQGDHKLIERIAHTIKGASLNMGAVAIAEIASEIEKLGKEKTLDKVPSLLEQIDQNFRQFSAIVSES